MQTFLHMPCLLGLYFTMRTLQGFIRHKIPLAYFNTMLRSIDYFHFSLAI